MPARRALLSETSARPGWPYGSAQLDRVAAERRPRSRAVAREQARALGARELDDAIVRLADQRLLLRDRADRDRRVLLDVLHHRHGVEREQVLAALRHVEHV